MVPKEQYARANGMLSLAEGAAGVFAPLAGGVLLAIIGLTSILVIDVVTFVVAISALLVVHVPQPEVTEEGREGQGSLWEESLCGFKYILARPSLLGLQLVFMVTNLTASFAFAVFAAMILVRTGNDEMLLGSTRSVMSAGALLGGLLLTVWGGPKRRIHGVLTGMALSSFLGILVIGLGRGFTTWAAGAFFSAFFIPIINGSNQAIWQAKVAPDFQGRVFATRRLIAQISGPLALLLAGPLADYLFEPTMMAGGGLSTVFGNLVGTGTGTGMSLCSSSPGCWGASLVWGAMPSLQCETWKTSCLTMMQRLRQRRQSLHERNKGYDNAAAVLGLWNSLRSVC
jgi:hypothetical protein